jgi:hypothetical protein
MVPVLLKGLPLTANILCVTTLVLVFSPDIEKAIFADGHHRQLPRLVKGPFK